MAQELIVFVTCPSGKSDEIVRPLVEERLAACVNVLPSVTSTYRWQDEVVTDTEDMLVIKTNRQNWEALEKRIKELHSYDTPEIISMSVELGYKPFLDWLNSSLRQGE